MTDINIVVRAQLRKGIMQQIGSIDLAELKKRLLVGLDGRSFKWLAERIQPFYADKQNLASFAKEVQRWVNGKPAPPVDFLAYYCAVTGVSPWWVMAEMGPMYYTPPGAAEHALELVRELADIAVTDPAMFDRYLRYWKGFKRIVPGDDGDELGGSGPEPEPPED